SESPVNIIVNTKPPEEAGETSALVNRLPEPGVPHLSPGFRREMVVKEPHSVVGFLDYGVRITNGLDFYNQYKDIFVHRVFHFETTRPAPVVIDAGCGFGMALLYFKHTYPRAHVVAFEPDPVHFRLLQENTKRNGLTDVTIINAGLGSRAGTVGF